MQLVADCHYSHWRNVRWIDGELDAALVQQIESTCQERAIDIVLPVDYPTVMLLADHGARIKSARVAAVPDASLMRTLHDKYKFSAILSRLGLPQPRTELADDAAALAATQLPFPIITKPVDRWASVGFQIHHTREELHQRIVQQQLAAEFPLLVQEFIPGHDVGFAFVARQGELVAHAAFEQPARGLRRYFDAPRLREYVALLLRETGYHGVGEIDTRHDASNDEYRLLEVNPRFWASLMYATRAGMNFPELLMRLDERQPRRSPEAGFSARPDPVRLSVYELGMSRSVLLAEEVMNTVLHWIERK
jgi:predicted ATP-grasp superfamily ATP-dependent carboligase